MKKTQLLKPLPTDVADEQRRDFEALTLLLLANEQPYFYRRIERLSTEVREDIVEFLVNLTTGEVLDCEQETRERAAMAVCRILRMDPLHLPGRCERCDLPLRETLECRCSKSKRKQ